MHCCIVFVHDNLVVGGTQCIYTLWGAWPGGYDCTRISAEGYLFFFEPFKLLKSDFCVPGSIQGSRGFLGARRNCMNSPGAPHVTLDPLGTRVGFIALTFDPRALRGTLGTSEACTVYVFGPRAPVGPLETLWLCAVWTFNPGAPRSPLRAHGGFQTQQFHWLAHGVDDTRIGVLLSAVPSSNENRVSSAAYLFIDNLEHNNLRGMSPRFCNSPRTRYVSVGEISSCSFDVVVSDVVSSFYTGNLNTTILQIWAPRLEIHSGSTTETSVLVTAV